MFRFIGNELCLYYIDKIITIVIVILFLALIEIFLRFFQIKFVAIKIYIIYKKNVYIYTCLKYQV